jgi:hypothetical protein
MRLEQIPIVLGALVALLGALMFLDAVIPDSGRPSRERRRRERRERSRAGEALVGLGTIAMSGALFGRDVWDYGTVSVLVGAVLWLWGAWLNRNYIREVLTFRGASRRGEKRSKQREDMPPSRVPAAGTGLRTPTPVARTIERELPIASTGLADRPAPPPDDGDLPGPEPPPRRMRIR